MASTLSLTEHWPSPFAGPRAVSDDVARPINLLNTLDELRTLLVDALHHDDFVDAFLFACGIQQIADDYYDNLPFLIQRAAALVEDSNVPAGRLVRNMVRRTGVVVAKMGSGTRTPQRRTNGWRTALRELVGHLARLVVDAGDREAEAESARLIQEMADPAAGLPSKLAATLVRLPSCFRSFDLRPGDVHEIVDRFIAQFPDPHRCVGVVGIRTSGSYLAPLYAASLRARGFTTVAACSMRPGHPMIRRDAEVVRRLVQRDGLALIADDPPETGSSVLAAAHEVHRLGLPESAIVLVLPLFGDLQSVPPRLRGRPAVFLPWRDWQVHKDLATPRAAEDLRELLPDVDIRDVERVPLPARESERGHTLALYRVHCAAPSSGTTPHVAEVVAEGVGLGYFGEHNLTIGAALSDYVPRLFGVRNGLLYREWLPRTHDLVTHQASPAFAAVAGEYFSVRRDALRVDGDRSVALVGQNPVWEMASNELSRVFARAWRVARLVAVDRVVRRLLATERPCVVDGDVDGRRWFLDSNDAHGVKVRFAEGAFSHLDLMCFDADFDVAALAASIDDPAFSGELRAVYEKRSRHPIPDERWLVYQLVHISDMARRGLVTAHQARDRKARAVRRYFSTVYFDDVTVARDGPLCAFDVDGVVETDVLGFAAPTASAARALRACTRHGFRPVLVSGRSLDELEDRCDSYRLAGCVAEYGAVVYDHVHDEVRCLLSTGEMDALGRVREALEHVDGVEVEPGRRFSVRAFVLDRFGRTAPVPEPIAAAAVRAACPHRVRTIHGDAQTDFSIARIDKARGLEELAAVLGTAAADTALAVGDSEPDEPLLALARRAFVPAHARSAVRVSHAEVTRHPYQVGLAESVERLLGHAPGSCPRCATPPFSRDTQLLLTIISAQEVSSVARISRLLALVWSAARR